MLDFLGPLRLFVGPTILIFLSAISMLQFKALYQLFAQVATMRSKNPVFEHFQPLLKKQLALLEQTFGSPAAFSPSTTHILLVAILIVLLARRD